MKILFGISVIMLVVFLDSVELLSPRRLPGQVHVPTGPPSTSYPSPPRRPNNELKVTAIQVELPRGTYIEDPLRGFIKAEKGPNVVIFEFENIIIGRIEGEDILPIFNKRHEIIRIDGNKNGLRIPMDMTEARRWGVFGKYAQFLNTSPPAFA